MCQSGIFISIISMNTLKSQIKKFDKVIATQMELLPTVLVSILGIGSIFSPSTMADINHFGNHA